MSISKHRLEELMATTKNIVATIIDNIGEQPGLRGAWDALSAAHQDAIAAGWDKEVFAELQSADMRDRRGMS